MANGENVYFADTTQLSRAKVGDVVFGHAFLGKMFGEERRIPVSGRFILDFLQLVKD